MEQHYMSERVNPLPKVGIRPIVDGRQGGIRESLEDVTMRMAKRVEALLIAKVRHSSGEPLECVISDTCIGGVTEAVMAEHKFAREGVGLTISVTPSWCYPLETIDQDPWRPKAIWGLNATERPGAVYLAAALSAHSQKGIPAFGIYGKDVQDIDDETIPEDVEVKLIAFTKAALAVATMRGKSYLAVGTVSMGIAGCVMQEPLFQKYLGMRNEYVDMTEFQRRINQGIYDPDEFNRAIDWVKRFCAEGDDVNPPHLRRTGSQKEKDWDTVVKMALIGRDLIQGNPKLRSMGFGEEAFGHSAIAAGFQGQRAWSDHLPIPDFMESILNSSFDWNGPREPIVCATENDGLNAVSMLFGHLLTDRAQIFADVRTYWSPDAVRRVTGHELPTMAKGGVIHLTNSGAAALDGTGRQSEDGRPTIKPFWDLTNEDRDKALQATTWYPAIDFFRGGGFSCQFVSRGNMPMTMVRLNWIDGLGPVLQLAEGFSVDLPAEIHDILNERTNPTWPTTWFVPNITGQGAFRDVYSVMNNWGSNHCAVSYGHIGADIITLACMLRIPVAMHNVEENRIFRSSNWGAFGDSDSVGADFRACRALGPLYQ